MEKMADAKHRFGRDADFLSADGSWLRADHRGDDGRDQREYDSDAAEDFRRVVFFAACSYHPS